MGQACGVGIRRSFLLLLFVFNHQKVLSDLTVKPMDAESLVTESTYFNCSSTITDKEIEWVHYPVGAEAHEGKSVYADGKFYRDYENDFVLERNNSNGTYNIVIKSVKTNFAGRYECKDKAGLGNRSSAQLIVLDTEPVCNSDMNPNGAIGPNPCGIQPDELHLSCSVAYHGNIPPELRWNRLGMNYSMSRNVSGNQVTYDLTVTVNLLDSSSSFECQITRSRASKHSCTTPTLKLLYIYNATTVTVKKVGEEVNCSANTSSSFCDYKWKWFDKNNLLTVSSNRILKVEKEGMYRCEASCNLQNIQCPVTALLINATQYSTAAVPGDSSAAVAIWVTVLLVVFVVLLVLLVAFVICRRRKYGLKVPFCGSQRTLEAEGTGVESTAPLLEVPMENVSPSVESGRIPGSTADNPIIIPDDEQAMDGNTSPGEEQPGKRKKIEEPKNEEIAFALYPELLHVQSLEDQNNEQSLISGLVVLDKELFVAFENKSEVKVFQAITFEPLRSITVTDLDNPLDMVSMDSSLYISSPKKIHRVAASGEVIPKWPKEDGGGTLSVTHDQTIILSDWKRTSLREYSADWKLISEVRLHSEVHPFHAVKTKDDKFVVSYDHKLIHKVAKFHVNGTIIQSFSEMLRFPKYLAIRSDGYIFVVDQKNSRVLMMSPTLESSKVLLSDKDNLVRPLRIYLDEKNSRMFVVDIKTGDQKFLAFRLSKHKPGVNEEAAATKDRPHVGSNDNLKDSGGIEPNSAVVSIDSGNEEEDDEFVEANENLDVSKENLDETENLDEKENLDETENVDESRGKKRKR